jgi:hypothetical protein
MMMIIDNNKQENGILIPQLKTKSNCCIVIGKKLIYTIEDNQQQANINNKKE